MFNPMFSSFKGNETPLELGGRGTRNGGDDGRVTRQKVSFSNEGYQGRGGGGSSSSGGVSAEDTPPPATFISRWKHN